VAVRIALHDYAGHPFQVQLSRELARRDHHVLHLHCSSVRTGKGALAIAPDDPPSLSFRAISLEEEFERYSPWRRVLQEHQYAARLLSSLEKFRPELIMSANTPLFVQRRLLAACKERAIPFVFWQQDILGLGTRALARKRLRILGTVAGEVLVALERSLLRRSSAVVVISEDFVPILQSWGIPANRIHVIENWAPLDEIPVLPRDNDWAREQGLVDKSVLLYSGTLGLKHNPSLLLKTAMHFRADHTVVLAVISEGIGAEWLKESARANALANIVILGFQPYQRLPEVFASADILLTVLDSDAGAFSVPSKVLSYHCAGRPLLAALPRDNLARRTIERAGSGVVVDPEDETGFTNAADELLRRADVRSELGRKARRYAEQTFALGPITDRFEDVFRLSRPV
jgi:colanic acid biosynthesis glycosyl transferase WcaI